MRPDDSATNERDDAELRAVPVDRLARILHAQPTLEATLQTVLKSVVELCPGASGAGVNLFVRGRFEPQAVLGAAPPLLDELQKRIGAGPCIEASRTQEAVVVADTGSDDRWPEFMAEAQELDVAAVVCVPMWVDDSRLGSLSLYADRRDRLGERTLSVASMLATHAALAIVSVRRSDNLRVAVESRDVIGQAKGILMERFKITSEQAFELLTTSSQATHLKVSAVAEELTSTGELPLPRRRMRVANDGEPLSMS